MSATKEDLKSLISSEISDLELSPGKTVKVKPLSLSERTEVREMATITPGSPEINLAKFQAFAIIKGTVEPKLEITDIAWIESLPSGITDRWVGKIYELSGIGALEAKKKD